MARYGYLFILIGAICSATLCWLFSSSFSLTPEETDLDVFLRLACWMLLPSVCLLAYYYFGSSETSQKWWASLTALLCAFVGFVYLLRGILAAGPDSNVVILMLPAYQFGVIILCALGSSIWRGILGIRAKKEPAES